MSSVLITGSAGGIGRALTARFQQAGWTVHASERSGPGLTLDVTNEASVLAAKAQIGVPDVVINNAGLGLLAPMAETPDEQLARQLDVNVRGLARVTRAFVPEMCRRGKGRVINVGSLAGVSVLPWFGAYAATKFAVEAMTDALRLECQPFGVEVVLIEPSVVGTAFVDAAVASLRASAEQSLWSDALEYSVAHARALDPVQVSAQAVAEVIFQAASARRPKPRYRVGRLASLLVRLSAWLPTPLTDVLMRQVAGIRPHRAPSFPHTHPSRSVT
jgi:NAD(P)-dependent dehydrogenase (short-subunit alcohol dehydrogenase family)